MWGPDDSGVFHDWLNLRIFYDLDPVRTELDFFEESLK